ncbi:UPF0175 family protein [Crocosphaera watsonii]|nr:UPF0175 family protein [Crocosphaera watsonii]
MKTIQIQLPTTVFSSLRKAPEEFVQEMRIANGTNWVKFPREKQQKSLD